MGGAFDDEEGWDCSIDPNRDAMLVK